MLKSDFGEIRNATLGQPETTREFRFDVVVRLTSDLEDFDLAGHRYLQPTREDRLAIAIERDGKQVPVALLSVAEILDELDHPECDDAPLEEEPA
jgi:hypothetical protein